MTLLLKYCLALWDKIFDHFPLFEETLPPHGALQLGHQLHIAKSANHFLIVHTKYTVTNTNKYTYSHYVHSIRVIFIITV